SRGPPLEVNFVRDRRPDHRDRDHVPLRDVHPLADRLRHLAGLADACSDAPVQVADDDQRAERELPATLDDLGDAVDADDSVGELGTLTARMRISTSTSLAQNSNPASRAASASALILP